MKTMDFKGRVGSTERAGSFKSSSGNTAEQPTNHWIVRAFPIPS